jgi:hypothetical protein
MVLGQLNKRKNLLFYLYLPLWLWRHKIARAISRTFYVSEAFFLGRVCRVYLIRSSSTRQATWQYSTASSWLVALSSRIDFHFACLTGLGPSKCLSKWNDCFRGVFHNQTKYPVSSISARLYWRICVSRFSPLMDSDTSLISLNYIPTNSRGSSIGIVIRYGLDDRGIGVRVLVELRISNSP